MEAVAYTSIPHIDISNEHLKKWINNTKGIILFNEAKRTKVSFGETNRIKVSNRDRRLTKRMEVPLWQKATLTLEEAAEYSGIGIHKIRQLTDMKNCDFVLWNGNRRLIKRRKFDEYIDKSYSI